MTAPTRELPAQSAPDTVTKHFDPAAVSGYDIRSHYDVPTDFYRLWLDSSLTYSCALWTDTDDLERAQMAKLDHLIGLAGAADARRVLDVGCGWGSMLHRLVESYGVQHAVGLTVSRSQAEWIAAHEPGSVEVQLQSWSDHTAAEPYDAIVSIGAFEHFALDRSTRDARVATYRQFFMRCAEILKRDGRLGLQTVTKAAVTPDRQAIDDARVADKVFPSSAVPWPAEILLGSEGLFEVTALTIHGEHYARTTRVWEKRLEERRREAVDIVGEATVELWLRYLAASARLFERGYGNLMRIGLKRV